MSLSKRDEIMRRAEESKRKPRLTTPDLATITPAPASKRKKPSLVFWVVVVNMAAWIILLPVYLTCTDHSVAEVTRAFLACVVFIPFYVGLTYIYWRYFWLITGVVWTAATVILTVVILLVVLGFLDAGEVESLFP